MPFALGHIGFGLGEKLGDGDGEAEDDVAGFGETIAELWLLVGNS